MADVLVRACLLVPGCSFTRWKGTSLDLLYNSTVAFMKGAPLWPNYFPEAPFPDTFIRGLDFDTWIGGHINTQSATNG